MGDLSLDKDGVRTAGVFAEMANAHARAGRTLVQHLQLLYRKYGFFEMNTSYFFCHQPATMATIFDRLRTLNNGTYVDHCGKFKITGEAHFFFTFVGGLLFFMRFLFVLLTGVRDITRGYDTRTSDHKTLLPKDAGSQVRLLS